MTVITNTTDRKAMAKAMAEHLGTTAKYMGMPSCGYQVGDYVVDKEGNIHGEDFEALRDFLQTLGCFPEEETEPAGEQTEPEPETTEIVDQVSITVPADDLTAVQLKNLIFMLYTKQYLIGMMTGGDLLSIPDTLIARLMENTPETTADFLPLLDAAKENGMTGFEFAYGKITITHQAHQDEPERNMLYAIIIQIVPKPLQYCIGFWLQRFWNRNSGQLIENAFHYRIRRYLLQIQNVLSPGQRVCHVPHRFFRNGLCLYMGLRSCLLDILDDLHKYPSFQTVEKQFYTERYSGYLSGQAERNRKSGHSNRYRTVDDLLHDRRICPEETILQIGKEGSETPPEVLLEVVHEYHDRFNQQFGELKW